MTELSRLVEVDFWERSLPGSTREEEDRFMRNIVDELAYQSESKMSTADSKHPVELFNEKLSDHCIQEIINNR